jgi:hypothetical protein
MEGYKIVSQFVTDKYVFQVDDCSRCHQYFRNMKYIRTFDLKDVVDFYIENRGFENERF